MLVAVEVAGQSHEKLEGNFLHDFANCCAWIVQDVGKIMPKADVKKNFPSRLDIVRQRNDSCRPVIKESDSARNLTKVGPKVGPKVDSCFEIGSQSQSWPQRGKLF